MPYDPRDYGARCDVCPLGPDGCLNEDEWLPVRPEFHNGATTLAVSDVPGPEEEQHRRPLVGRAGTEWRAALVAAGKRRPHVDLTHTIDCRPPGVASGAFSRMEKKLERMNKKRAQDCLEPLPHPVACCRPRLLDLANQYEHIITLGRVSTTAITGVNRKIQSSRGGPIEVEEDYLTAKVFPTIHPTYVSRAPAWRSILQADVGKAFRWFEGRLNWTDPDILWRPTAQQLRDFLARPAPYWAYDVETDGIIPTECGLRTIAIAIPDLDVDNQIAKPECGRPVATNSSVTGITLARAADGSAWYSKEDEAEIKDILRQAFIDGRTWVGHNAGSFDRLVVEHHFGVTPAPLVDTLFSTRFRAPDLPKGLKTIGSVLTDIDRWETTSKGESIATGSTDDDELLHYNCLDSVVNARILPPLIEAAEFNGAFRPLPEWARPSSWPADRPWDLHEVDHVTQDMCVMMHRAGIWIDQDRRQKLKDEYTFKVAKRRKQLVAEAKVWLPSFDNPGSGDQVRRLVYDTWGLGCPPQLESRDFYTESGLPATKDTVIRALLAAGSLTREQSIWLRSLRLYRREHTKILGTILTPMNRRDQDPKKGIVFEDGRVRSSWNAHVTSVGRLSSSSPNLQNIGNRKGQAPLKTIFSAPPGRIYIGADLDQAHLRITASYWQIPLLLECFDEGKDPHNTLAYAVFGKKFSSADGWGPDGFSLYRKPPGGSAKNMRDIIKTFRYASIYWASPSTVWQVLTSTETDNGDLPYLGFTVREVRAIHSKWMKSEPEWLAAWRDMLNLYKYQGFMEEPVFLRRSGILSGGKKNEVVNYPILAAESSLMRIAEHRVMEAFPYDFAGRYTGLVHQCHDSLVVEVPDRGEAQTQRWTRRLEECMTIDVPGWAVRLTAEGDSGKTLKDV